MGRGAMRLLSVLAWLGVLIVSTGTARAEATSPAVLLRNRAYSELDAELARLLAAREKNEGGVSQLFLAYKDLRTKPADYGPTVEWVAVFREWVRQRPESHFAHASLGMVLVDLAQEIRGMGWADSVTPDARKATVELSEEALGVLARAHELGPSDPFTASFAIRVMLHQSTRREAMEAWFDRGIAADPTEIEPYAAKLLYLMPKWHGSAEEMFAFARAVVAKSPAGTILPSLVTTAHWELFWRGNDVGKNYFPNPAAWAEMREAYERILSSFPRAIRYRNFLAKAAYLNKDYQRAKTELGIIGEGWEPDCWVTREYFDQVKAYVYSMVRNP